jgi:hypothetical protein
MMIIDDLTFNMEDVTVLRLKLVVERSVVVIQMKNAFRRSTTQVLLQLIYRQFVSRQANLAVIF